VRRTSNTEPPLFPHDPHVVAVAADHPVETQLPVLDLNDAAKIAAFIVERLDLA
jgi:molybdopterin-guanine dinucleotide biosynthesis protein B